MRTSRVKRAALAAAFIMLALIISQQVRAQFCCECRTCPSGVAACTSDPSFDRRTYAAQVCEPIGCATATCLERACERGNRCPSSESGQCNDGADNDADGAQDCQDGDCAGDPACSAEPPEPPGSASNCCVGSDNRPGCDQPSCDACVCEQDGFCCLVIWDVNCAFLAMEVCTDACACDGEITPSTPMPSTPTPAQTVRSPTPGPNFTSTPRIGLPCRNTGDCRSGEVCQNGNCVRVGSPAPEGGNGGGGGGCSIVDVRAVQAPPWGLGAVLLLAHSLVRNIMKSRRRSRSGPK